MSEIKKLAEVLTGYSVNIKKGHEVAIFSKIGGLPLVEEIYSQIMKRGAHPSVILSTERLEDIFMNNASEVQLTHVSPLRKFMWENTDVFINVWADANMKNFSNVVPERLKKRSASQRSLTELFLGREAEGKLQWTLGAYPTDAMAQEAQMSYFEYRDFVYSSCLVDRENPIDEWKKISKDQEHIADFLNKAKIVRFTGEDTDLTVRTEGRNWINCDGKKNMPDGEVFTGPIEGSAEGKIRFTYPGIYQGKEVEDIRLFFEKGKVIRAEASKGEDLLKQMIAADEGASRIGEISVGTNPGITRFTKNMLFDEKMGGTMHLALGFSIPESGGKNISAIHWDILKDMKNGEIYADDVLFFKDGKFLI